MKRRQAMIGGGVAAVAAGAGAGAGWAWWRGGSEASSPDGAALQALWAGVWPTPGGSPLALADFRGKPLLLNFWATWCPPCVEELPLLNAFYREHRAQGWQVLGLAVDQAAPVQRFVQQHPLDFPVAVLGLGGGNLSRQLGNAQGVLPFTVVLDRSGAVVQRKLGRVRPEDLARWVQS